MHFSVIFLAMIVATISITMLCITVERNKKLSIRKVIKKHETVVEYALISGLFMGMLIDLLIGQSLLAKFTADIFLIPMIVHLFIKPFIGSVE